jgi:hypothetical protein
VGAGDSTGDFVTVCDMSGCEVPGDALPACDFFEGLAGFDSAAVGALPAANQNGCQCFDSQVGSV